MAREYSEGQYLEYANLGAHYSPDEVEWLKAVAAYRQANGRPYLTAVEWLEIAISLGYRKVCPPTDLPRWADIRKRQIKASQEGDRRVDSVVTGEEPLRVKGGPGKPRLYVRRGKKSK